MCQSAVGRLVRRSAGQLVERGARRGAGGARGRRLARHAAGRGQAGGAVLALRAAARRAARPAAGAAAALPRLRLHEARAATLRAPGGLCTYHLLC